MSMITVNETDSNSHPMEQEAVNEAVLLTFFRHATASLDRLPDVAANETSASPRQSIAEIRQTILSLQMKCLQTAVDQVSESNRITTDRVTAAKLQALLRDCGRRPLDFSPHIREAMEQLHQAARSALCRCVLHSELLSSGEGPKQLRTSGRITEADVLEFCGLCSAAIRIPVVRQYLQEGTPLFASQPLSKPFVFPQERLAHLQRLILRALGYDPDFGTREIQRLFFPPPTFTGQSASSVSPELQAAFRSMEQEMEQALREITAAISQHSILQAEDSVTRIVSVTYSEKIIDAVTGQEITTLQDDECHHKHPEGAPQPLLMAEQLEHSNGRAQADLAHKATQLEQEILGEILSLRDEVREECLRQAQLTVDEVLQRLASIPSPEARVTYMRSLDATTQRSMVMKKVWDDLVTANGNQPPVISYNSRFANESSSN